MNSFDQKKAVILEEISTTSDQSPDASPKGTIDELCRPIIDLINAHKDMFTTSLCSGRVSVFLEGIKDKTQVGAKGNEGRWLFVTHNKADVPNWWRSIDFVGGDPAVSLRYILFKFEPLILHVKCRDYATANALFSTAMGCGFRESGIGSNNVVGIRISLKLDVPIGHLHNDQLVRIVSEEYLQLLSQLAVDRFDENERRMGNLFAAIEKMEVKVDARESKEARRERKIREGLARREQLKGS